VCVIFIILKALQFNLSPRLESQRSFQPASSAIRIAYSYCCGLHKS